MKRVSREVLRTRSGLLNTHRITLVRENLWMIPLKRNSFSPENPAWKTWYNMKLLVEQ